MRSRKPPSSENTFCFFALLWSPGLLNVLPPVEEVVETAEVDRGGGGVPPYGYAYAADAAYSAGEGTRAGVVGLDIVGG